jgi:hypothetical protein
MVDPDLGTAGTSLCRRANFVPEVSWRTRAWARPHRTESNLADPDMDLKRRPSRPSLQGPRARRACADRGMYPCEWRAKRAASVTYLADARVENGEKQPRHRPSPQPSGPRSVRRTTAARVSRGKRTLSPWPVAHQKRLVPPVSGLLFCRTTGPVGAPHVMPASGGHPGESLQHPGSRKRGGRARGVFSVPPHSPASPAQRKDEDMAGTSEAPMLGGCIGGKC